MSADRGAEAPNTNGPNAGTPNTSTPNTSTSNAGTPKSDPPKDSLKNPKKSPKKGAKKASPNVAKSVGRAAGRPDGRSNRPERSDSRTDGRKDARPEPARRELRRPVPGRRSRRSRRRAGLDTPLDSRRALRGPVVDSETFGRWSEAFARFMGTAWFLVGMTVFVGAWLAWNALAPAGLQFDPRRLNFTLLTLILSLQASYAAPLILLAQNRQADRDRVTAEQDRDRGERALADTEYLAREVANLRILLGDVATRDFVRSELRSLLDEATIARKGGRKPIDSFGSTSEVVLPTDSG